MPTVATRTLPRRTARGDPLRLAFCWAHGRRKLIKAKPADRRRGAVAHRCPLQDRRQHPRLRSRSSPVGPPEPVPPAGGRVLHLARSSGKTRLAQVRTHGPMRNGPARHNELVRDSRRAHKTFRERSTSPLQPQNQWGGDAAYGISACVWLGCRKQGIA